MFRKIIIVLCLLAVLIITSAPIATTQRDSVLKIRVRDDWLNFDEAASLVRRFDKQIKKIEEAGWKPESSPESMQLWINEITPMFMYEGLATSTDAEFQGFPTALPDGFDHNHIAGRSDCQTYMILNARYFNSVSGWFARESWPVVVAHELAHIQQGQACSRLYNSQNLIENSAQIMAWEAMAALGNQGSADAVLALVYDLRGTAMSSARAIAASQGRENDYQRLRKEIYGDDISYWSRASKGDRFWAEDEDTLNRLMRRYSWTPLNMVFKARHEGTIYQLALSNDSHAAEIDDLIYFFQHMEELVDWALDNEPAGRKGVSFSVNAVHVHDSTSISFQPNWKS